MIGGSSNERLVEFALSVHRRRNRSVSTPIGRAEFVVILDIRLASQLWFEADRNSMEAALRSGGVRLQGDLRRVAECRHWLGPGETESARSFLVRTLGLGT